MNSQCNSGERVALKVHYLMGTESALSDENDEATCSRELKIQSLHQGEADLEPLHEVESELVDMFMLTFASYFTNTCDEILKGEAHFIETRLIH